MDNIRRPLVSICCMVYNHENFIRQCLDGFVMQQTTFSFEILIHEDASTDSTATILKEYEIRYPQLFRCVYQTVNQFALQNTLVNILFPMSQGTYIAYCEGDDYWTDPFKLQKQIDFLEANQDYSLCFHDVEVVWENKSIIPYKFCQDLRKNDFDIFDIIDGWFIPSASMVLRTKYITPIPAWFSELSAAGDYALHLLCGMHGKVKFINQNMAVYRKTLGTDSMTSRYNTMSNINGLINLLDLFNVHSKNSYSNNITIRIKRLKFERYILSQKFKFPKIWAQLKKIKQLLKGKNK